MTTRNRLYVSALVVLMAAVVGGLLAEAANPAVPTGWLMVNRDRAKWAMGQNLTLWGTATGNNAMTVTGLLATDTVWGVIDMTSKGTTQATLANLTPAADALASSDTPWTGTRKYMVFFHRPQAGDR